MSDLTPYVVLKRVSPPESTGSEMWIDIDRVAARSADAAVRAHAESDEAAADADGPSATYVAIPARSWNPREVSVEVERKVVFGGGGE